MCSQDWEPLDVGIGEVNKVGVRCKVLPQLQAMS
jgi:hypothetical protein